MSSTINVKRLTIVGKPLDDPDIRGDVVGAYSCSKKLNRTYSGPCLRVRRPSDDAETDIGFLGGKIDVYALRDFLDDDLDGRVVTVYSQLDTQHLTQTDPSLQPKISWPVTQTRQLSSPQVLGGEVFSASSTLSVYSAGLAFDGSYDGVGWHSLYTSLYDATSGAYIGTVTTVVDGQNVGGEWIQIQFTQSIHASNFSISARGGYIYRMPYNGSLVASNDGSTWTSLIHWVGETYQTVYVEDPDKSFTISNNTGYYKYYRLICESTVPGGNNNSIQITQFKIWGSVLDDDNDWSGGELEMTGGTFIWPYKGASAFQFRVVDGYFNDNVSYFDTSGLTELASGFTTDMSNINTSTNGHIPLDNTEATYSVQWIGLFSPPTTGTYTFYTNSDDASYFWIGTFARSGYTVSNAIVSNPGLHGMRKISGSVVLEQDTVYDVRIQFGENAGGDNCIVSYTPPGGTETTDWSGVLVSPVLIGLSSRDASEYSLSTNTTADSYTYDNISSLIMTKSSTSSATLISKNAKKQPLPGRIVQTKPLPARATSLDALISMVSISRKDLLTSLRESPTSILDDASGSTWNFGGTVTPSLDEGVPCLDMDGGYMELPSTGATLGQEYTVFYYWKPVLAATNWRTLHRNDNDHIAIVQSGDGAPGLGIYSNRDGGFRDTGYDVLPGVWQTLIVTNVGDTSTSTTGTGTFYVNNTLVGTTDRVGCGTRLRWIGYPSQPPGKVAVAGVLNRRLSGREITKMHRTLQNWGRRRFASQIPKAVGRARYVPVSRGLVGWYNGNSWNGVQWTDVSGANNHVVDIGGTVSVSTLSGFPVLSGTTSTSLLWPASILPGTYTFIHVAKYNGSARNRIFDGNPENWLSGFWSGRAGVAHHNGWLTSSSSNVPVAEWVLSTDQNSLYRANMQNFTTSSSPSASSRLSVNDGRFASTESSDWAIAEIFVYDRHLTAKEYGDVEEYLNRKYSLGF